MHLPSAATWRAFLARFLIALVVIFVLTAGSIGAAYWTANRKFEEVEDVPIAEGVLDEQLDPAQPANFLIVGSDSRAFVDDPEQASQFGTEQDVTGQRSDTIMVVHVDPGSESGMVLSFPRDLLVDIPGIGRSKINAAYGQGPETVIQTIQQNFDIKINHYLEVDFAGFEGIVDAIGTVDIYFPAPARDEYTHLSAPLGGCQPLDGAQALAYARSRHYEEYDPETGEWNEDPTSDIGRIARQQYFMRTLAREALDEAASNPLDALNLLDEAVPNLRKDPDLAFSDMRSLVAAFQDLDPRHIPMETMPYTPADSSWSALLPDYDAAAPLLARMRDFTQVSPPDVDPGDVTVQVLNGSGVSGVATDADAALTEAGFVSAGEPGDADAFDHATTEVRYSSDGADKALLVAIYLDGAGKLVEDPTLTGTDVELVLGADFHGVVEPVDPVEAATTTTTTAPAATTNTTVPIARGHVEGLPPAESADGLPLVGCPPGT